MARSIQRPPRPVGLSRISATVTLALWQLRLTWRLLLVSGAGVVAAVILVCTVPLYSQVAMSAGLRNALSASDQATITIHGVAHLISQSATQRVAGQIQQELQQNIGQFLSGSQFSVQSPGLAGSAFGQYNQIQLMGWSINSLGSHVKLLEGRLPQNTGSTLEMAITPEAAKNLNLAIGARFDVAMPFLNSAGNRVLETLSLSVVGIFVPTAPDESYWHGTSFGGQALGQRGMLYPSLVSNASYLSILETLSNTVTQGNGQSGVSFEAPSDLYWYYSLDPTRLDINHLDELASGLNNVLVSVSNQPVAQPYVDKTTSSGPSDLVNSYNDRIAVARIPLLSLAYLIAGLMLFFVSLMTDLLVDRQSESIAVLRSRGASRQQIFSSLVAQSIGVGLVALIGGPLVSVLLATLLVHVSLPVADQGALNVILDDPVSTALNLYISALATVVVSILAMVFALNRASRMDVLALRRESARSVRGPAWLRMGLDVLAGVIAVTGYGFSVYITSPGVLDARTRVLILPPMTLVGAVFLLLGCMLLFLRIFPFILELLSNMAVRNRGATSMLAVAQMARAPRQSLRMTLLLALAVAFGIFSLVFSASQTQRIPNVAAYQVGADFTGTYPNGSAVSKLPLSQQEAAFEHVPGVTSASVGFVSSTRGAESGVNASIELRAVDADNFAKTALWNAQDSSQSLDVLMQQLARQRAAATSQEVVPAIVDAAAWKTLSLTPGAPFTLSDLNGTINYVAIGQIDHIPTVNDSADSSGTNDYVALGGVLVDFTTYQAVLQTVTQGQTDQQGQLLPPPLLAPTTVWLSTQDDVSTLTNVRAALASGSLRLLDINDRRELESTMGSDPLYLALLGVLAIGAATALLLGLLGNMTVSWLSARSRLINFAVMRALGTAPRQIASILTYEQVIVYATAIGLGVAFGILLSFLVLPAFVFTSATGNVIGGTGVFYVTQSVPPIQMIIPVLFIGLAVGILVAICIVALGMMVRIVSRPALSTTLRLNSD
ncbi:MAG TPA: FtsX-like permease family protein [Ktedonobacteraceae bacterium]|nr:FtsX-like permease family protein [Ktedonobacteraceae bacterium]